MKSFTLFLFLTLFSFSLSRVCVYINIRTWSVHGIRDARDGDVQCAGVRAIAGEGEGGGGRWSRAAHRALSVVNILWGVNEFPHRKVAFSNVKNAPRSHRRWTGKCCLVPHYFFFLGSIPPPPVYPHTPRLKNEKGKRQNVFTLLLSTATSSNAIGGRQNRGAPSATRFRGVARSAPWILCFVFLWALPPMHQ